MIAAPIAAWLVRHIPPRLLGASVGGLIVLLIWGWLELRVREPLVDLRVSARAPVLLTSDPQLRDAVLAGDIDAREARPLVENSGQIAVNGAAGSFTFTGTDAGSYLVQYTVGDSRGEATISLFWPR